jgi:branched-chain amino acid transport system substrate-binding protein
MKWMNKGFLSFMVMFFVLAVIAFCPITAVAAKAPKATKVEKPLPGSMADKVGHPNAKFDADKMGDMSAFDPATWEPPTGDTIKIAVVGSYSGPGALNGAIFWASAAWVAYDINKRGGIYVDGKKKLVELIKADHMSKADQCKKICERMVLQEKVKILWGTNGSNMMKIMNDVAHKYKIISMNFMACSEDLQSAKNFSRYAFKASFHSYQTGEAMAYYYGQIRKKEKRFYILCEDYSYGIEIADGFKKGLKKYYPEAQIVGEDYHKIYLLDFAPYLEKIKASTAEVIYTGDWIPDGSNLLKQARELGVMLPIANNYLDDAVNMKVVGVKGTDGLVNMNTYNVDNPQFKTPGHIKIFKAWNNQWKKWKNEPYNSPMFEYHAGMMGTWVQNTYWLMSVIERAKSTDAEAIIKVFEGDTYQQANGKIVKMRACDHKIIQDINISVFVPPSQQRQSFNIPPYHWFDYMSHVGPAYTIPAEKVMPWVDPQSDRCKGKDDWGE